MYNNTMVMFMAILQGAKSEGSPLLFGLDTALVSKRRLEAGRPMIVRCR